MELRLMRDGARIEDERGGVWGVVRTPKTERVEEVLEGLEGVARLVVRPTFEDLEGPAWMPGARARWNQFAAELARRAEMRVLVMPDAGAIVSDVPGTLSFLRGMPAFGLVCDPEGLMVESMRKDRMDHLARFVDALVGHGACDGVVVGGGGVDWERALRGAAATAGKPVVERLQGSARGDRP